MAWSSWTGQKSELLALGTNPLSSCSLSRSALRPAASSGLASWVTATLKDIGGGRWGENS